MRASELNGGAYGVHKHVAERSRAFHVTSRTRDVSELGRLLAEDVVVYSNGGGESTAASEPVGGATRVEKLVEGIAQQSLPSRPVRRARLVRRASRLITRGDDGVLQTTALAIDDDKIVAIYSVRNPDELARGARRLSH